MPNFAYRGRSGAGEIVQGIQEGATAGAVADLLFGRGVTPIEIKPAAATADKAERGSGINIQLFKQKVEHVDVLLFSRQIYTLLRAGVPIMRALAGLQESSTNPAMRDVLQDVRESLDSGRDLSVSLGRHPSVFTPFYVSMVRVGEMTGRLEQVFIRMFDHLAFERFMQDQVKSALRYPSFVIAAMGVAIVIVNIFVIPAFAKVFKGFGAELPLMTRILIGFSDFMLNYWHVLLLGIVAAFFAFKAWLKTPGGRYTWDRLKLKIPIAGKIVRKATLARFAASFSLASRSGVPIIQALTNVAETVNNAYISAKVEKMRDGVERGESILRTSIAAGVFTPVVLQMIAVGEETGKLDEMLLRVASIEERQMRARTKIMISLLAPVLILIVGALVGFMVIALLLPIFKMSSSIQ